MRHVACATVLLALLVACGPETRWDYTPQDEHVVRSGETLFAIAWRYGKNPVDLARWNKLGDGNLIHPGQVLRLKPPQGMRGSSGRSNPPTASQRESRRPLPRIPTGPPPPWRWPTAGKVIVEFGKRPGTGSGILIAGKLKQAIRAAAAGRVVYSGSGLIGYGELVIIKHNNTYLSAYGYNASLFVKEGEKVGKGQRIATMGDGPARAPGLHFEIRKNGEPVDPRRYLPAK